MQERCQEESKEHFYSSGDYSKFYQKAGEESMYCQKKSSRCQISDYRSETRPQSVFTSLVLEGGPGPCLRAVMHMSSQKPSALEVNSSAWLTNRAPPVSWEYSIWEFLLLLFLTVEKYWSCSIKRIKLTTVCVWGCVCIRVCVYMCIRVRVCVCVHGRTRFLIVLCVLPAWILVHVRCRYTHIPGTLSLHCSVPKFLSSFSRHCYFNDFRLVWSSPATGFYAACSDFRSHRMSRGLSGIYLFCLKFWQ